MAALVLIEVRPKEADKLAEYMAAATPIVTAFEGEFIHRGTFVESLTGSDTPHRLGVIRFPNVDAARHCFASPEYQVLARLREEAADMRFSVYETAN